MGFSSVAVVLTLCLLVAANGSRVIKTLSVGAPITGAHLNPLGAIVNTQVHKTVKTTTLQHGGLAGHLGHAAPIYGPYGGAGLGAGYGAYGAISPYGIGYNNQALLGGYGLYGGYGGYPSKYGGYQNVGLYPSKYQKGYYSGGHLGASSKHYGYPQVGGAYGAKGLYNAGVAVLPGAYHGSKSYGYGVGGGYVNPLAYQTGITQISYNHGYPGYGGINKLRGYGK
ncbi:keratin-associated protein 19-2-like [Aplysia californica]|uniref:Keratin-associated protein 19-2-like n=1 Tax=Aplysia californica TaxID=6500 RepID=A0ABM1A252_APLCA|nr:keratin-associated protein 19-2-like [Aplysia californica]